MTTTKSTIRASVAVIVADVLMLQSRLELPALQDLYATSSNGIVTLNLYSADAQVLWADALNIPVSTRSVHRYDNRSPIHTAYAERLGWSVHVKYDGPEQLGETLPPETVAVLEQIATADAVSLVAETVAALDEPSVPKRPPWSAYGPCAKCDVGAGEQCVFTRNFLGAGAGSPRQIAHQGRPLVEVVQQPTAEDLEAVNAALAAGYTPDPECGCDGKCRWCALMGCEACCDSYANGDHGVKAGA
jgi:hypothetical protein